jgi:hypothetical protein
MKNPWMLVKQQIGQGEMLAGKREKRRVNLASTVFPFNGFTAFLGI